MAYYIDQRMWDDEKFLELDDASRVLFILLLTGPQRSSLPGLMRGTIISLSETLKRSMSDIELSMRRLEQSEMVILDRKARIICLPNAPKYAIPPTGRHLKGWWVAWTQLPDCSEKMAHVPRLQQAVNLDNEKVAAVWEQTFYRVLTHQVNSKSSYAGFSMNPPTTGPVAPVVQLSDKRAQRGQNQRSAKGPTPSAKRPTSPTPSRRVRRAGHSRDDLP